MAGNQVNRVPLGERVFAVCVLLYGSTAFIRLLMSADDYAAVGDDALGSPVKRILWPVAYLTAGYFLAKRYKPALDVLRRVPLLFALMAYIAASVLWSGNRTISILSVAALAGNTLIGFYFGVRYGMAGFLRLLGRVYGIVAVASAMAPIAIGKGAFDDGFWIGFFAQKNALGMNMTIGFLVFVMLAKDPKRWRRVCYYSLATLCAGLILLSGSGTSIVILFVLVCAMILHVFLERYKGSPSSRTVFAVLILVCSTVFVLSYWSGILSALGKGEDLTGRVNLWGILVLMAREKPFLGYGYGAFWVFGGPAQTLWDTLRVDPNVASYAHNGYLQLLMDGGIVGVGLLLALVFAAFKKAWAYLLTSSNSWPLYFVVFLVLHNLAEATFVVRNNICWLLFVAILVQLVRALPIETSEAVRGVTTTSRSRQARISSVPARAPY